MAAPIQYQAQKRREIAERQRLLAGLRLAGIKQVEVLADRLGVSVATVRRDLRAQEQEWREHAAVDVAMIKAVNLARSEEGLHAVWLGVTQGNMGAVDRLVKLLDYQSRLLGLNAPDRQEWTGADGGPIEISDGTALSEEERTRRIDALYERVRSRVAGQAGGSEDELGTAAGPADGSVAE